MNVKRKNIEALLSLHDNYVGSGNVKSSGRLVPRIVRALLDYIDGVDSTIKPELYQDTLPISELQPAQLSHVELPSGRRVLSVDVGNLSPEDAKQTLLEVKEQFENKQTCEPCSDMSDMSKFGLSREDFETAKKLNEGTAAEAAPKPTRKVATKRKVATTPAPKTTRIKK